MLKLPKSESDKEAAKHFRFLKKTLYCLLLIRSTFKSFKKNSIESGKPINRKEKTNGLLLKKKLNSKAKIKFYKLKEIINTERIKN